MSMIINPYALAVAGGGGPSDLPDPGLHSYWRVLWVLPIASGVGIAEVEFRATVGGADQANGGTAMASSVYGTPYSADKAFANDGTTSEWANGSTTPAWIGYHFTAPVAVQEVYLLPRSGLASQAPSAGRVQYSDDGSTWATAWSFSYSWTGSAHTFALPSATPIAVYWRVNPSQSNDIVGAAIDAAEIEFRATAGGADQCSGGTALADNYYDATYVPANAFDNNNATNWASTGQISAVGYHFVSNVTVDEVAWRPRSGQGLHTPRAATVEYGTDGENWRAYWSWSGQTGSWDDTTFKVLSKP